MINDPLDGFRGVRPPSVQRALSADGISDLQTHQRELMLNSLLGGAAERLMQNVASRTDIVNAIGGLVDRVEIEMREKMAIVVAASDLTSKEAREAHFEARVCAAIIAKLNSMVATGLHAAQQLTEEPR